MGFKSQDIIELNADEAKWNNLFQNFLLLNKTWLDHDFFAMAKKLLSIFNIELTLSDYPNAERRLTNLYHIVELLGNKYSFEKSSPLKLTKYLREKIEQGSDTSSDEELIRLESDEDLVQIVTMHASKGLEYEVVFCPFLWESMSGKRNPLLTFQRDGTIFLDIGTDAESRQRNETSALLDVLAERLRLTYVALTRAKTKCLVFWVDVPEITQSAIASLIMGSDRVLELLRQKSLPKPSQFKPLSTAIAPRI